jgi:hypothetical protein
MKADARREGRRREPRLPRETIGDRERRYWLGAPPREWLGLLFFPVGGAVIVGWLVHAILRSDPPRTAQWLSLALGLACGLVTGGAYTLRLALEHRLFLRDAAAIARNRSRVATVGVPLGIAIALAALLSGALQVAFLAALVGVGLGLEPGVVPNFLRLRREEWLPASRGRGRGGRPET